MDQIIIESIADGAAAWMLGELPDISGITKEIGSPERSLSITSLII